MTSRNGNEMDGTYLRAALDVLGSEGYTVMFQDSRGREKGREEDLSMEQVENYFRRGRSPNVKFRRVKFVQEGAEVCIHRFGIDIKYDSEEPPVFVSGLIEAGLSHFVSVNGQNVLTSSGGLSGRRHTPRGNYTE